MGVGHSRLWAQRKAAVDGRNGPRTDMRCGKKQREKLDHCFQEVMTFIEEVYVTERETLPEHVEGVDAPWKRDPDGDAIDLQAEVIGCRAPGLDKERRYLPLGCPTDMWRQLCEFYPAIKCNKLHFLRIWAI